MKENKLKSLKVAKWRKDEWMMNEEWWREMKNDEERWRIMKDERWMMKDDDFKLLKGFALRRTDICDCRVAFAAENSEYNENGTKYFFCSFPKRILSTIQIYHHNRCIRIFICYQKLKSTFLAKELFELSKYDLSSLT